jgi:hypothetical protein
MKSTKKLNVSRRNALHREPLRPVARGQDLKGTFDGYRETGAQAGNRDVESQSGWSDWDSGRRDLRATSLLGSTGALY